MEEVDSIIIHFLRQLHVIIDPEIKSICELRVETIIESASKCLTAINNSFKLPTVLPSGISHRIEVASQIASFCKDLGYKNDVGYQTFLYYNETELRQVFMFLIENLPNESKQTSTKVSNNVKSQLMEGISIKISEELNKVWIPPCCTQLKKNLIGDFVFKEGNMNKSNQSISVKELIEKLKNKNSFIQSAPELQIKTSNVCESKSQVIKTSLKELKEQSIVLHQKLETLENERNCMDLEYSQAQKSYEKVEGEVKNIINLLKSVGIVDIDNDNTFDNVMEKVQSNISMLHRNSENITSKNLSIKLELDKIKSKIDTSESERNKYKKQFAILKEEAKAMKEEYNKNEETKNQLKKIYEISKGGKKRSIYTKRILEIISNVDKQNMEIKKILDDTRQLQKEINSLEGQLDRCFSIADETLFRDAKKDDQAKKAYKLLALLHSECSTIVSLVNDTGALSREIVDLEDHIKTEKSKKTEDTLKKIHLDLTKMQQESLDNV